MLDTCFITADSSGRILLKQYDDDEPRGIADFNSVASQCNSRSIGYQNHVILKLAFDKTYQKDIFAFLTQDLFCVFSTSDYYKPLNYLLLSTCPQTQSSLFRRNSPRYFRSFAFCGGGNVLLLTDSEIYRWNYKQNSACSLLYTSEHKGSYRCIRWKAEGNIIGSHIESNRILEVLSTEELSLFVLIQQEGDITQQQTHAETLGHLKSIRVSKVRMFDSFVDYAKRKYEICSSVVDG